MADLLFDPVRNDFFAVLSVSNIEPLLGTHTSVDRDRSVYVVLRGYPRWHRVGRMTISDIAHRGAPRAMAGAETGRWSLVI